MQGHPIYLISDLDYDLNMKMTPFDTCESDDDVIPVDINKNIAIVPQVIHQTKNSGLEIKMTNTDIPNHFISDNIKKTDLNDLNKANEKQCIAKSDDQNRSTQNLDSGQLLDFHDNVSSELKSKIRSKHLKHIPKLTIDNDETSRCPKPETYKGVSDRIKTLTKRYSLEDDNPISLNSKICVAKGSDVRNETRKLSVELDVNQKTKHSYRTVSLNSNFGVICQSPNIDMSNSEIVEEIFSPVCETAKQLEQHLYFPTSPTLPKLSPRIPKLTRFARLSRLLSNKPDPDQEDVDPSSVRNDNEETQ